MSWERAELDWDLILWETTPTPWPRHVLLRWLRYVDGCVLRGVRYHVPQHCCARVKEIAHTGKAPGRRLVQDVSGCGEDEARRLLAQPEEWRDPHRQELVEDPNVALIRKLRAENEALRAAAVLPPGSRGAPAGLPPREVVPGVGPNADSRGAPAALPPGSRSRDLSARVHPEPLDPDQDPSPRVTPPAVDAPPAPTPAPVGGKSSLPPPPAFTPPPDVQVGDVTIPGDLSMLLDQIEIPRSSSPAYTVLDAYGVQTTAELLAIPAKTFGYGGPAKVALANRLREYLPRRWGPGVVLGCLAPVEAPRPGNGPRTGRRGEALAAALVASIASRQERADRGGVVDAEYEEVFEDVRR